MAPGILLIHGFTGKPEDFGTLPESLAEVYGPEAVTALRLPGHGAAAPPRFDAEALVAAVRAAAAALLDRGLDLVLICHSTGGTLALEALREQLTGVSLLVLISVPKRVDGAYLARWQNHATPGNAISFSSLAALISLINRTGSTASPGCRTLLVHGEADPLVPCEEMQLWEGACSGPTRAVVVPGAGHHLFAGEPGQFVGDLLLRAIADACFRPGEAGTATAGSLTAVEPEAGRFLASAGAGAVGHLALSPAVRALEDLIPELGEHAAAEPVFLNIEVTTRCNLRCAYCARTRQMGEERDMSRETFRRILDLAPNGYRVTLVGLGEPLQHPEICLLVKDASSRGRRVSLVTNALELTRDMGEKLLDAGLDAITFSLDTVSAEVADQLRHGSDLERILENIREFGRASDSSRKIPRAIFSAVSTKSLPHLEELVRTAATLGVDALMLSDLNFAENAAHSLGRTDRKTALKQVRQAVRTAFTLGLPVLSVHGLEELGLPQRYRKHLLAPASTLFERSSRRTHCLSPWQTLPISVDGTVTVCDCQPGVKAGNILHQPFTDIWQGAVLAEQRRRMLAETPPPNCAVCPRF